jgi:tol-pal system protein YbgF
MDDMTFKISAAALSGLAIAAFAVPASAGTKDDVRDLQARMERVEQGLSAQSAGTVRVSELERQIQVLTGRIEELNYQLDLQNQRLDAISAALAGDSLGAASALGPVGGGGFGAPNPGGPAQLGPAPLGPTGPSDDLSRNGATAPAAGASSAAASVELPLNPSAAYDYASSFLLSGDYARAKAAFQLYTEAFPNHARTPDAKFRLGEIHLALGENADAAAVFLDHVQKYPNDARAAEAHLKLGTAFARMDQGKQACDIFKTMKSKFPAASQSVTQRADLEMARIDCS